MYSACNSLKMRNYVPNLLEDMYSIILKSSNRVILTQAKENTINDSAFWLEIHIWEIVVNLSWVIL